MFHLSVMRPLPKAAVYSGQRHDIDFGNGVNSDHDSFKYWANKTVRPFEKMKACCGNCVSGKGKCTPGS